MGVESEQQDLVATESDSRRSLRLSDHFTARMLFRFALPSIAMMIFTSIYSLIDGLFVSNCTGKEALAAVNLAWPLAAALGAFGFMFGTGGSAIVAITRGQGKRDLANHYFSLIVIASAITGVILAIIGILTLDPMLTALGSTDSLFDQAHYYGFIILIALPTFILLNVFQCFFVVAEKPKIGFAVTLLAGCGNIVFDFILIFLLGWGVVGAAFATAIGQILGVIVPIIYFWKRRPGCELVFTSPSKEYRILLRVGVNGSSELMTEVAVAVVGMLYNYQLMNIVGADGVAAYGVIMDVNFIFTAIFFGFAMGTAPIISYHFGDKNTHELQSLFRKTFSIVGLLGLGMFALSQALANPIVGAFVGYDADLTAMTLTGFRIYAFAYLICGFNIYGSAFFTALNNGKVSALISFLRTFIFETSTVMILPIFMGLMGVWSAIIVAEVFALIFTIAFLVGLHKRYGYYGKIKADLPT